jgi:hypothetical protein
MKAKPSKSYICSKVKGNYKDLLNSVLNNGAKLEKVSWNKEEYWIYYPEGGCHKISVTNYNKIVSYYLTH